MISAHTIATNTYTAAAYVGVGIVLMLISFVIIDALTPGNLRHQLWVDRNRNACILVGSNVAAIAIIVAAAISASEGRLGTGLLYTVIYTVIGLVAIAVTFLIIDVLTPGRLGAVVIADEPHPAAWVHGISHVGIAVIVAAAIL